MFSNLWGIWGQAGPHGAFPIIQGRYEPAWGQSALVKVPTTETERSPLPLEGPLGHELLRILIHPKVIDEINYFSLLLRHIVKKLRGLNKCNSIQFNYILPINLVLLRVEAEIWHFVVVVYFCYCFFFSKLTPETVASTSPYVRKLRDWCPFFFYVFPLNSSNLYLTPTEHPLPN